MGSVFLGLALVVKLFEIKLFCLESADILNFGHISKGCNDEDSYNISDGFVFIHIFT